MASLDTLTQPTTMQNNMAKSRRIHQHLTSRRNRWKPSELELAVMKLHFQKNQYPSKEDKESIINIMRHKFESKIDINQLSRWFQHEREKILKHHAKGGMKSTYKKFSKEELIYLQTCFEKNNYPRIEEMTEMSKHLNVSLSKIENWYKHNRRALAKKGAFTLKTKKYFKKDELSYLVDMFETHPRPTKEQVNEISEKLNCDPSQIKNWYANKRKKMKILSKRQDNESTEASLHKISPATYAKSSLFPNGDPILTQPLNININLPSLIPQPIQPKPILSPPRQLNMPLGSLLGPAIPNNLSNGPMPVILVPTTNVNNPGPMIINSSLLNNPNQPIPIQKNNLPFPEFPQGLKSFEGPQEAAKFPILTPIHQNFPPQNISLIPMNTPNLGSNLLPEPFGNHPQSIQEFKAPENLSLQPNIIPLQMAPIHKAGLTPIGPMTPLIPIAKNGEPIPILNPNGAIPITGNDKSMPPGASRSPIQIQYMTSLYLPYSQNTYYNNYCPIVYQPHSDMYVQGSQVPPQMSMNSFPSPNGAQLNLLPNINIPQFGNAGPQMNRLKPMN